MPETCSRISRGPLIVQVFVHVGRAQESIETVKILGERTFQGRMIDAAKAPPSQESGCFEQAQSTSKLKWQKPITPSSRGLPQLESLSSMSPI